MTETVPTRSGRVEPKYTKLADELRDRVQSGKFKPGDRMPSLAEMQAEFGVSLGTVQKVHAMLEQEGLIVREQGKGTFVADLLRRRTGIIGFIGNIFSSSTRYDYSIRLASGIRDTLQREEMRLLILDHVSPVGWDKVDGVLIGTPGIAAEVLERLPVRLPRVTLMISLPGTSGVLADDHDGARQVVQNLAKLGHKRIAFLVEAGATLAQVRTEGYLAGLNQAAITFHESWVYSSRISPAGDYQRWGYESMREWLRAGWEETGCTALLVQNDLAAAGAMEALREAGISVPGEVSVVGFDGTEVCNLVSPRLSSVEVPLRQIGAEGTELLLRQIENPGRLPQIITLPTRFQLNDSVRALD